VTIEVSDVDRGSAGNPAIGKKPVSTDRSTYLRSKGGFEELNVPTQPE
jgi:hypothetical protein